MNKIIINNVLYPYMEMFKGNRTREKINFLKNTQQYSYENLVKLQKQKLIKLLTYCLNNVQAYKSYKELIPLIKDNPYNVLEKISPLTKEIFVKDHDKYLANNIDKNNLISNRTGGSTGQPVKFYLDRNTVEFFEAARWRGLSWWDIDIADRSVMIWGSPIELNRSKSIIHTLKERVTKNRIVIPAYNLNPDSIALYINKINKYRPDYFYGYSSALYTFANMAIKRNKRMSFSCKGVVSTAETLHDYQRKTIEKFFECPVINEYGARDGGIIAYECPNGNMHLSYENAIVEILDINTHEPVKNNQLGLIAITDLNNFSMPRLRYILGDVGKLSNKACDCGISLPILEKIEGREDDMFITSDGEYVHGHYFNHIARSFNGISQFQIIQHNKIDFTLKIVKNKKFSEKEIEIFKSKIIKKFGEVNINIQTVDNIPLTKSGKIRYAIREFDI